MDLPFPVSCEVIASDCCWITNHKAHQPSSNDDTNEIICLNAPFFTAPKPLLTYPPQNKMPKTTKHIYNSWAQTWKTHAKDYRMTIFQFCRFRYSKAFLLEDVLDDPVGDGIIPTNRSLKTLTNIHTKNRWVRRIVDTLLSFIDQHVETASTSWSVHGGRNSSFDTLTTWSTKQLNATNIHRKKKLTNDCKQVTTIIYRKENMIIDNIQLWRDLKFTYG